MRVRHESMRVDKSLASKYAEELSRALSRVNGLSDIEGLLNDFERRFAGYIGRKFAVAVNSGTDALQLSLYALGIGSGDKVILPSVTYSAVGYAVLYSGAEPVIVDVDPERFSISPEEIEKAIDEYGETVKAVIVPHMFGFPANIEAIRRIKEKYGVAIIEDVCQAESSRYRDRYLGSFFDIACFSFSYYKPISSCGGGGGMVCFDDERFNRIRDYTQIWRDDYGLADLNKRFASMYLMDYVAVNVKFKYINHIIKSRRSAKKLYEKLCDEYHIDYLKEREGEFVVLQNFPVLVSDSDDVLSKLEGRGVYALRPYLPLHERKVFARYSFGACKHSETYRKRIVHLPLFSFIKDEEIRYVVETLASVEGD